MRDKVDSSRHENAEAGNSLVFCGGKEGRQTPLPLRPPYTSECGAGFSGIEVEDKNLSPSLANHNNVPPYREATQLQSYVHTAAAAGGGPSTEADKDGKRSRMSEVVACNIMVVPVLEGERLVQTRWPRPEHRLRKGYYPVSWVAFFAVFAVLVATETILTFYTATEVPKQENQLYYLEKAASDFILAVDTNSSSQVSAATSLVDRLLLCKVELTPVYHRQMIMNFASLGLVLVCISLALWWRHHDSVKSRGKQHLLQLCVAGVGLQLSLACLQATIFLRFLTPPTLENYATPVAAAHAAYQQLRTLETQMYGCQFAVYFFMCYIVGSFVQRQRVIYHLFVWNPFQPLKTVNYFTPAPWHAVVSVIVMSSYTIKLACFECVSWTGLAIVSGVFVMIAVYTTWLGYYIFRTTSAHQKFSDFAQNLRILIGSGIFALMAGVTYVLFPTLIYNAMVFSVATRCFNNLIVLDMLICQVIQSRYVQPERYDGDMGTHIPRLPVPLGDSDAGSREKEHASCST